MTHNNNMSPYLYATVIAWPHLRATWNNHLVQSNIASLLHRQASNAFKFCSIKKKCSGCMLNSGTYAKKIVKDIADLAQTQHLTESLWFPLNESISFTG